MYLPLRPVRNSALWLALVGLLALAGCQSDTLNEGSTNGTSGELPVAQVPVSSQRDKQLDSATWPLATGTLPGVAYRFKHPASWTPDLTYCAPGAAEAGRNEQHLPANCASTDFLVGQKVLDVGTIRGDTLSLNGKTALRAVDTSPPNALVSRIYTLIVRGEDGRPLFGLVSMVGPGTTAALQEEVTATLDEVAATLRVEKQP